jgi:hypothetical protein
MKSKSLAPVGSLHPVLFLAGIYVIALFLSIFICSSLFYSCNASSPSSVSKKQAIPDQQLETTSAVALR